jgi:hypothetical protein
LRWFAGIARCRQQARHHQEVARITRKRLLGKVGVSPQREPATLLTRLAPR